MNWIIPMASNVIIAACWFYVGGWYERNKQWLIQTRPLRTLGEYMRDVFSVWFMASGLIVCGIVAIVFVPFSRKRTIKILNQHFGF